MHKPRLIKVAVCIVAFAASLAFTPSAFAFDEAGVRPDPDNCIEGCHGSVFKANGPHGIYGPATKKCGICHGVHDAVGVKLLPSATVVDTCFTCHDGTGGQGVYGAIKARTGADPAAGHRYSATNVIPGGDAVSGGPAVRTFREANTGNLICSDCHSVHGTDIVTPYGGERARTENLYVYTSSKLLRRQPTGADGPVDDYGSDWCFGCHSGRNSGGAVHNHPVESTATVSGLVYVYRNLPILVSAGPTRETVLGGLAGFSGYVENTTYSLQHSRGFLMPLTATGQRSPLQVGHYPICQQCHEDSRNVGSLSEDGVATSPDSQIQEWEIDGLPDDPGVSGANPRFQNFPHETVNANLLVETEDNLCLNCHPVGALP